jgi:hypothetical protein
MIERVSNALGRACARGQGTATKPNPASYRRAPLRRRLLLCAAGLALAGLALAGCGLGNGPGSFMVDPGRYEAYRCNDLVTRWKALTERERDLRALMDKASQTGTGVVIGTLAYRADYESVLTEQKLVQREAAEKKCELTTTFQSDQSIR